MTDEELSRAIVEHLEPRPKSIWDGSTYWRRGPFLMDFEWHPGDMVNDPAMTVLLLEKLIHNDTAEKRVIVQWLDPELKGLWQGFKVDAHMEYGEYADEDDVLLRSKHGHGLTLGRAVAECYAKACGL